MNIEHRKEIRELSERVRASLQLTVPVDVEQAVEKLNGKIVRRHGDAEAWVRGLADGDAAFEIGISPAVAATRYRFSVAHEIAHLFLHMGFMTPKWNASDVYSDGVMYRFGYSREEAEANEFAATLLMPEDEFRAKVSELAREGKVSLDDLASHFQVSNEAARLRGCYLGLFAW